jgi:predicted nucleotidyltransferase
MDPAAHLREICKDFGLQAVYLFGSRARDGIKVLSGYSVPSSGSDLDVGVFGVSGSVEPGRLGELQAKLTDLFSPLRVDLVPLDRVDPLFQYRAISGERIAAVDSRAADEKELEVMRRAADLLPFQRQLELETFGTSTS